MLTIGSLSLTPPLLLAPLAGYTDLPFRILAAGCGCSLVCTEMVSAHGLVEGNTASRQAARTVPEERPVAVQLFGADPGVMGRAAALVESELTADVIDINMGCPVPKVVKSGSGSALMRDPDLAARVVEAVVQAVKLPVTVKIRSGWDCQSKNALEIALNAASAGAAAVTIHPRTRSQGFKGLPDEETAREVSRSLKIPVIWSGDIRSPEDARMIIEKTGCDGVMVGKGSLGRPWILRDIAACLSGADCSVRLPGRSEIISWIRRHVKLITAHLPEEKACGSLKPHLIWYLKGFPGARQLRTAIGQAKRLEELTAIIDSLSLKS